MTGRIEHVTGYDPHDGSPTGWTENCDWCHGTGEIEDEMQEDIDGDELDEYLASAPCPEPQNA